MQVPKFLKLKFDDYGIDKNIYVISDKTTFGHRTNQN